MNPPALPSIDRLALTVGLVWLGLLAFGLGVALIGGC
jgi:hypothetical protein